MLYVHILVITGNTKVVPALSSLTGLLSVEDVSGDAHSHFVMCYAHFELVMNT
jgi:hypothetical protein